MHSHKKSQRRLLLAAAVVAAALGVTACGGSSDAPTVLDTEKVERAIEDSTLEQRGVEAQVSCPSGVHQKEGLSFECNAVADGRSTTFVVTQIDGSGQVHYEAP